MIVFEVPSDESPPLRVTEALLVLLHGRPLKENTPNGQMVHGSHGPAALISAVHLTFPIVGQDDQVLSD